MGDTSPRSNHGCLLFLGRDWLHIADDNSPTGSTTKDKLFMGRVRALTSSIMLNPQLQRNRLPRANNTRPGERSNRPAPCFARLIRQHPPSGGCCHKVSPSAPPISKIKPTIFSLGGYKAPTHFDTPLKSNPFHAFFACPAVVETSLLGQQTF